jgi:hypothetical protein
MLVSIRVPDDVVSAVDAAAGSGQRSAWILDAIVGKLGVRGGSGAPGGVSGVSGPVFARRDDEVLWLSLLEGAGSERVLCERLGWMPMRVTRAVGSLMGSGLVRAREGLLEAVSDG